MSDLSWEARERPFLISKALSASSYAFQSLTSIVGGEGEVFKIGGISRDMFDAEEESKDVDFEETKEIVSWTDSKTLWNAFISES